MLNKLIIISLALVSAIFLVGCGGGSGSSNSRRALARERAIASARLTRATFASVGLGRRVTRASHIGMGSRAGTILSALHHTRDAQNGKDPDTGLYYTLRTIGDGSGRQDLFTDAAMQIPAGSYVWGAPMWANNTPDSYPAMIHVEFNITGGEFSGDHGTLDISLDDATGSNGTIHSELTDSKGEKSVGDFNIVNGKVKGKQSDTLPDGVIFTENDVEQTDGTFLCTIIFQDNSTETLNMNTDGTVNETIMDSNGQIDATGTIDNSGMDNIQYSDGSSEMVNVDTANAGDQSADDSNKSARIPKIHVKR